MKQTQNIFPPSIPLHGGFLIENTKNPHGRCMVKKTSINNCELQITNQQSFIIDQLYPLLSPYVYIMVRIP